MAKTKKLKKDQIKLINLIAAGVAALLGLLALVMAFVPSVTIASCELAFTGINVTFGFSKITQFGNSVIATPFLAFSFMNFLTYALVIAGIALVVLSFLNIGGKYIPFIAAACFLLAALFFFLQVQFTLPTEDLVTVVKTYNPRDALEKTFNAKNYFALGTGAIVAAISSILAALGSLVKVFVK